MVLPVNRKVGLQVSEQTLVVMDNDARLFPEQSSSVYISIYWLGVHSVFSTNFTLSFLNLCSQFHIAFSVAVCGRGDVFPRGVNARPLDLLSLETKDMRYNEKELLLLARQPAEKAAELFMKGYKKGDVPKKRLMKLVVNFLFYFRVDEEEPVGALLLEQCKIAREDNMSNAFSIAFVEEPEKKYIFECENKEQCDEWIDALTKASYEFMRKSLIFYRTEIQEMTGKDPLEQYGISDETRFRVGTRSDT
ncbi:pleckstrin homology domain-containing family J member 1 [Protopterus annectens]|uniref:pleckstrin homology domain-containing family J member 1 n=1 Tax=Protopterus annectens TaxID=7888 RepID=UPI001CFAE168|nr:pleckstrin homology domain-containing family J member 1 [Protopterus annectens]